MVEPGPSPEEQATPGRRRSLLPGGLSARLLLLTALFVAIAGGLVMPPAMSAYEEQWLLDRVRAAELLSLAAEADPEKRVQGPLAQQLLEGAGLVSVAIQTDGARRLVLEAPRGRPPYLVDLRQQNPGSWLAAPWRTLLGVDGGMVRVVAEPRFRAKVEFIEVVLPDAPLRRQLIEYLVRLVAGIAFAAALVGLLVYLTLTFFLVMPMRRITQAMERFRASPDDPLARLTPSGRDDELGRAEAELDRMQRDLLTALNSRARLAALGEAVAKINHDLRNMLTSAQLASERLAALGDPQVAQALPRLERALDRAVTLASDVLAYGKTAEPAPVAGPLSLREALEAAAEDAGVSAADNGAEGVTLQTVILREERVSADPDQLHRILVNLLRNAREAVEGASDRDGRGRIFAELRREPGSSVIRLTDDGPGVPERALANLFQPFLGSVRRGGTGLGLAVARELAQGHGGDLYLVETGRGGSVFELRLPGVPAPAAAKPEKARPASAA